MSLAQGIVDALTGGNPDQPELPLDPSVDVPSAIAKEIADKTVKAYIDSLAHGKHIYDHRVHDHGIMYSDYFQGAGTAFTNWDEVFTGTGENAHEALDQALDEAATDGWDVRSIENPYDPESTDNVQNTVRDNNPDMEGDDIDTDGVYYFVSLYVRGTPKAEDEEEVEEEVVEEAQKSNIMQQLGQVAIAAGKKKFEIGSLFRGASRSENFVLDCLRVLERMDRPKLN
jgi:hypothetical protein